MLGDIGKIQRVPIRDVWAHEALGFTTWLESNIDALCEALDLNLVNVERERPVGTFNVDLTAEDERSGNLVIIENQLGKSDHDHLGKVLTYLTVLEAKTAIWVVGDPRPEHIEVINRLNEAALAAFYLVKLEAIRIGSSPPAPLFTLITGPSEEAIEAGQVKKDLAERHNVRYRFWEGLLEHSRSRTRLHGNLSPSTQNWISSGAGLPPGVALNYSVTQHTGRVEVYIDTGDIDENHAIFDQLHGEKSAIESEFGEPLDWERLEGKRACRIKREFTEGGWREETTWPQVHPLMVDAMIRLDQVLRLRLNSRRR